MHEYPITCEIISIAEKYLLENEKHKTARVKKIRLVVGDMCGYVGESIQMYFDEIAKDTACSGAILEICRVKSKLKCEKCGGLFERKLFSFSCPECGGQGFPTEIGKEFYIDSIEIERD